MSSDFIRNLNSILRNPVPETNWNPRPLPIDDVRTLSLIIRALNDSGVFLKTDASDYLQSRTVGLPIFIPQDGPTIPEPSAPPSREVPGSQPGPDRNPSIRDDGYPSTPVNERPASGDYYFEGSIGPGGTRGPGSPRAPDPSGDPSAAGGASNPTNSSSQGTVWNQQMLAFFVAQLQDALAEAFSASMLGTQNASGQKLSPQQEQTIIMRALEQGIVQKIIDNMKSSATSPSASGLAAKLATADQMALAKGAADQKQMMKLEEAVIKSMQANSSAERPGVRPAESAAAGAPSKLLLAELALKLLSIDQLGQTHMSKVSGQNTVVARGDSSASILAGEMGKIVANLEHLKGLLKAPDGNISEKYFMIVVQRLKEVSAKMAELIKSTPANASPAQKQALLERLEQESEWLAAMVAKARTDSQSKADDKSTLQQNIPADFKKSSEKNSQQNASMASTTSSNPTPIRYDATHASLTANQRALLQLEDGRAQTLQPQMPRNAPELAGMIQAHLSKALNQPLAIMIPFPITLAFDQNVKGTQSAGQGDMKDAGKQGRGRWGSSKDIQQMMVLIPAGPVIFGDPFEEGRADERPTRIEQLDPFVIATTAVTNRQFAVWLSEELLKKTIRIDHPGKIYDTKGRLLAITIEGAPASQIELTSEQGLLEFRAIQGKENHPVVHVTYYGAEAFCEANGLRLPTELEWERAAGMMPTEYGQPLKKLRFGCLNEGVSASQFLYREVNTPKANFNLTLPVGFFDGQKVYTKANQRIETTPSISPWGCYDMSGNVREWTSCDYDEDGLFKTTKGGSYGDTQFDLRVAAKIPLPPSLSDAYTGFRVVL